MKRKFSVILPIALFGMLLTACNFSPSGQQSGEDHTDDNQQGGTTPVEESKLTSIEITHLPKRVDYKINEEYRYDGLEVTAHFDKSQDLIVPNRDLVFSGFSSESAGEKTIKVEYTYKEVTKETSFNVTVYADKTLTLDFYSLNDTHGNVQDSELGVGIAKTSTFLKNKTQNQDSVLISSGDMWQGSLESNSTRGALMTEWMQSLDFASMTVGNHEFDWGKEYIRENSNKFDLPILGINIIDKTTGKRADYAEPSTIIDRNGARIGIIGAIGDCYSSISYSKVSDVRFLLDFQGYENKPLTELIKAESTRLREEEGCDFIVYSVHGDTYRNDTYYNPELSTGGYVDVVFEGHTHQETYYQDEGNVWHFQASASGELSINHFELELNTASDEYTVKFNEYDDVYWMNQDDKRSLDDDAETLSIINQYDFAQYYKKLGNNTVSRSGSELRQLNAELYLDYGSKKWTTYKDEIVLGGGYISIRGSGYLPVGDVTYAALYNLFPFDNDVVLIKVLGDLLKSNFINSTNSNYFLSYSSYGSELKNNQGLIDDTQKYYVITDTYTYDYLYSYGNDVDLIGLYDEKGYYARDFLADYAKSGGFDTENQGLDPVSIENNGTFIKPYTVSEAYTLAMQNGSNSNWAYVKGVVIESPQASIDKNYITNLLIKDSLLEDYTMSVYKLHKYDGDENAAGFASVEDLPVGSEIIVYGVFKLYNDGPGFGSPNILVAIDDKPACGQSIDNPISVAGFLLNDVIGLGDDNDVYVFGKLRDFYINNEGNLENIAIYTQHNVDFALPYTPYYDMFTFRSQYFDLRAVDGINFSNLITEVSDVIIRIGVNNDALFAEVVSIYNDPSVQINILHAGTLDDPYSVTDALLEAKKHANQDDAPFVYCEGIVVQQGDRMGGIGDIRNVTIKDLSNNNEILIYYLRKHYGATVETNFTSVDDIKVGDRLIIC